MIGDIFYFLITLSILVTFHEFGHYWVARRCGVRVLRFSVGFGQPLWKYTGKGGTEFVIAAIPLGGYVKMLDEREEVVEPEEQQMAFNRQSAWRRSAILAAGPGANFLLAIFAYWIVFIMGVPGYKPVIGDVKPDHVAEQAGLREGQTIVSVDGEPVSSRAGVSQRLLRRLGDSGTIRLHLKEQNATAAYAVDLPIDNWLAGDEQPNPYRELGFEFWFPVIQPVIDTVVEGSPAAQAGLEPGDRILAIDQQEVSDWADVGRLLSDRYDTDLPVFVQRGNEQLVRNVSVGSVIDENGEKRGRIGISVRPPEIPDDMQVLDKAGILESFFRAVDKTGSDIVFTLDSLRKMFVGLISPTHLGGPVTIAKVASMSAQSGVNSYLQILALLSVSLGIFNLLPIPVLDGGHLLIIAVQAIIRRPVSEKLLMWIQQVGLAILLSIMVFAVYNDITRL